MKILQSLLIICFFYSTQYQSSFAQPPVSGKEILKRSITHYQTLNSYRDNGYIRTFFFNDGGLISFEDTKVFSTSFIRPDRFRFEYAEQINRKLKNNYIIWKNTNDVKTFWALNSEEGSPTSVSEAIAAATGVSSGSAHNIPQLFFPDSCSQNLMARKLASARLIGTEKDASGNLCYRIRVNTNEIYWVDSKSYLIKKIEEYTRHDDFFTNSFTYYSPQADSAIPEEYFSFKNNQLSIHENIE